MDMDVTSTFIGLTTPLDELFHQITLLGWEPGKVQWDSKLGQYTAEAKDPYGARIIKSGPNDKTAVGNLVAAIGRKMQMRTAAQHKIGMWKTMFTDQLPQIAEAYAKAPVYDPKAAAYWKELADDSTRRAQTLGQQLHIEVVDDPEPYANAQEMSEDIHKNKHFLVSRANSEHPVWSVDQNVAFRIVHDVMGHAVSGGDFGWQGENLACAAHFPLLTPTAQLALFTECIAQTAYAAFYRSFGPQKVAALPQFLEGPQAQNNPAGFRGVHPSQITAPTAMPSLPASPPPEQHGAQPEGMPAPHQPEWTGAPIFNFQSLGKTAASAFLDPNANWTTGIEPLQVEHNGVGNAYLDHGDPLQSADVMDNASLIDTGWHSLQRGDGSFDRERAKLAIVNAFRVVLLSPRKDLRWNAAHYQDISHIPANTDDPKVYWDALEKARREWNQSQGIDPNAHMIYFKFLKPFESVIHQMHPELNFQDAKRLAEQTLFQWWTEEQQRIMTEDEKKPADKQRTADEIERRANEALAKRLKLYLNDKFNPQTDVAADDPAPLSLFGRLVQSAEQYNLLTGQPALKYGAFMGAHLKSIAQISQHADEILDAALEDVHEHDATGHHFRAKVLSLGISGVGPKVCSFAWLLLQPLTSQLATIDTHMMDVLGHDYEKEMNNRDYFKFERELAAGRDAAGYSHVPLGPFQWGMWDFKRTGPGSHQDHSAMRVLDPVDHRNIDWAGKAQNLKGESWLNQAPDWWRNTQAARDAVAHDWDTNVAPNFPQNAIPYQVAEPVYSSARVAGGTESMDEFHVALDLPDALIPELQKISDSLNFDFEPEDPKDYHMTVFWSEHGYNDRELHEWINKVGGNGFWFHNARIDSFGRSSGKGYAVVLRFDSAEAREFAHKLMDEAEDRGLDIKRFPGGYKAHITLGWTEGEVKRTKHDLEFRSGPAYVSVPRPLRRSAMEYKPKERARVAASQSRPWIEYNAERPFGAPGQTIMDHAVGTLGLSTPEIWRLLGESAGKDGDSESNGEVDLRNQDHPAGAGVPA